MKKNIFLWLCLVTGFWSCSSKEKSEKLSDENKILELGSFDKRKIEFSKSGHGLEGLESEKYVAELKKFMESI